MMQKGSNTIQYQKIIVSFWPVLSPWSHNSYKCASSKLWCYYMQTKTNYNNYIKEISIKNYAKKKKYYQISKLSANSLAMIKQFLSMCINEIMMLLCQNNNKLEWIT